MRTENTAVRLIAVLLCANMCAHADAPVSPRRPDCVRDFETAEDLAGIWNVYRQPFQRSPAAARSGGYGLLVEQPFGDRPNNSSRLVIPLAKSQLEAGWTHVTFFIRAVDVFENIRGQGNIALDGIHQDASKTDFSYRTDWKKIAVPLPDAARRAAERVELIVYFNLQRRDGPFQIHLDDVHFERKRRKQ